MSGSAMSHVHLMTCFSLTAVMLTLGATTVHIIKMLELYALLNLVRLISGISKEFSLMEKFKYL